MHYVDKFEFILLGSFIVSFSNKAPDPEKDSAAVQAFLANMEGAFRAHTLWAGSSEEELESAGEVSFLIFIFVHKMEISSIFLMPFWKYIAWC